jgi:D-serine deaminase-like pyridoxal phosphate-dependent protein
VSAPGLDLALDALRARPWQAVQLSEPVPVDTLPTPALLLDLDAFDRNLRRMHAFLAARGKGVRPHAKTHKCPLIAARQLEAGAVGVCAAKVSEAAVLVHAGIGRVLVTSPVVGVGKARLLAELAAHAEQLDVVVDSVNGLEALLEAVAGHGGADVTVGVVVDVDVAMGRTGTRDTAQVCRLAEQAAEAPGLAFRGIQHYAGHLMHVSPHAERRDRSLALWASVSGIVDALSGAGLPPPMVTGAGTGTYDIDSEVDCLTDLQVGSYVFMDQEYRLIGGSGGGFFDDFEVALQVSTTVISQPVPGMVTVDGGYKAFASDTVDPEPLALADARFRFAGDEHGVLVLDQGQKAPMLGSVQRFITPHCDPTVNLYDYYWICREGLAVEVWPIAARGCSW